MRANKWGDHVLWFVLILGPVLLLNRCDLSWGVEAACLLSVSVGATLLVAASKR